MLQEPYIGMPINFDNNTSHGQISDVENADTADNGFGDTALDNLPLAMSYVPFQKWKSTYPLDQALQRGTLFPDLDLPFQGGAQR